MDRIVSEQWMPIAGYEGLYSVSSLGRIRSEARSVVYAAGKSQTVRERIMAQAKKQKGHRSVMLYGKERRRLHVHRLVALAFIGPQPSPLHEVAHCNGDPSNNAATNLRWATRAENHADKLLHGTHNRGERHPLSKLTNAQTEDIRASTLTNKQIAAEFGICASHAWAIKNRKTRTNHERNS